MCTHTHPHTRTHELHASLPQINQVIRKEAAHQLPFSSERRTERQMDGEKRSLGEKMDDNNHNCRVAEKQKVSCARVCVQEREDVCDSGG